jgi:hypothetical protein
MKNIFQLLFLSICLITGCSTVNKSEIKKINSNELKLASTLTEVGFSGLFQYGERSLCDSVWQDGENQNALLGIVSNPEYHDYARILASEVLYAKSSDYPPANLEDKLAYIYSKAIEISGSKEGSFLSGNLWGFMYYSDKNNYVDYGQLGSHLMKIGKKNIPHLIPLLDNSNYLFYEGSEEATIGNSLKYRVKDVAAYYIGKLSGISIQFYEKHVDRDAEIERLKEKLKNQ